MPEYDEQGNPVEVTARERAIAVLAAVLPLIEQRVIDRHREGSGEGVND